MGSNYGEMMIKEKTLCDLHLGSAINVDSLLNEVGVELYYRVHQDPRIGESLKAVLEAAEEYQCGFLPAGFTTKQLSHDNVGSIKEKMLLASVTGHSTAWKSPKATKLLNHLDIALKSKGLLCRFGEVADLMNDKILIPDGLTKNFSTLINVVCQVSELIRGGVDTLYSDVHVLGRVAISKKGCLSDGIQIATDGTIVVIRSENIRITTWEDLLCALDTIGQRICFFISNQVAEIVDEPGWLCRSHMTKTLEVFDELLKESGNGGYNLIGMFEPLVVSEILRRAPDNIVKPELFHSEMLQESKSVIDELHQTKLDTLCKDKNCSPDSMRVKLSEFIFLLTQYSPEGLSNLFCAYRIWGHPYVDIYEGLKKVHKIGTTEKPISGSLSRQAERIFKEHILVGKFKSNHKYPAYTLTDGHISVDDSYILTCLNNSLVINRNNPGYFLDDLDNVRLGQSALIPQTYDLSHILNDKAVSPRLSEIIRAIGRGENLDQMEGRRGVIRWLDHDTQLTKDFLDNINKEGLEEEDLVIGMYEKEREMKNAARMFALMSENMRYYFVLTEEMIAEHILPCFPQITMKDSLNKLQKKLWTAGSNYKKQEYNINVNIDFSKWNTNMRSEFTEGVFRSMDHMLGFDNLISRTHEIFRKSLIYSCSGKYMPKVVGGEILEEPPMCYRGHLGGMEGLRQKGWTVATVCLIDHVARSCGVSYKLLGQGDNQIIKMLMRTTAWDNSGLTPPEKAAESRRIALNFLSLLTKTFAQVGLPIKSRECWMSARLFMYGKQMLLDDRVLPQWSKKLLRSYALTNEGILTLSGTIGTLSTNCMSAMQTSTKMELSYSCYAILAEWTVDQLIIYHPFARIKKLCEIPITLKLPGEAETFCVRECSIEEMYLILAVIPSSVGGSTNIPLTTYLVRGFPDPASEGYSWLNLLKLGDWSILRRIADCFFSYMTPKTVNAQMLISAPSSINHRRVVAPLLNAKQETEAFLISNYSRTNSSVRMLKTLRAYEEEQFKMEELLSDPMNPLISNEIYSLTPDCIICDLVSRVQMTRTVKKLTVKCNETDIIRRVQDGEMNYIGYLRWRLREHGEVYSNCATMQARVSRSVGWGREVIGVTTPHPLEIFNKPNICNDPSQCVNPHDYIYCKIKSSGSFPPYLGSKVKSKVQSSQDPLFRREPLIKQAARIYKMAKWMRLGPNMMKLIADLCNSYIPAEIMDNFEDDLEEDGVSAGALDHRLGNKMMSDGCFINYAPQVGSAVFLSSDNMPTYGRGQTNYTLQFQALYGFIQYFAASQPAVKNQHWHIDCNDCVHPTVDDIPDIDCPVIVKSGRVVEALIQMFPMRLEPIKQLRQKNELQSREISPNCSILDIRRSRLRWSLTILLAVKIARESMYEDPRLCSVFDSDVVDLQFFPRIYCYKIFSDELLYYVSRFLVLLQCVKKGFGFDSYCVFKAKRAVVDNIRTMSAEQLKPLCSLLLEPKYRECSGKLKVGEGSIYPETLSEKIAGSKVTLQRYVGELLQLSDSVFHDGLILSCGDVSLNDMVMIGLLEAIVKGNIKSSDLILESLSSGSQELQVQVMSRWIKASRIQVVGESVDFLFKKLNALGKPEESFIDLDVGAIPGATLQLSNNVKRGRRYTLPNEITVMGHPPTEICFPTAAIYKWAGVGGMIEDYDDILVLGDGTGGTSYSLANTNQSSLIHPTALIEYSDIVPQDLYSLRPPISRNLPNVKDDLFLSVSDDITSLGYTVELKNYMSGRCKGTILICSDIEACGGSILRLKNIADLWGLGADMLIKCYISEACVNDSLLSIIVDQVDMYVPVGSNTHYGECFLLMYQGSGGFLDPADMFSCWIGLVKDYNLPNRDTICKTITEQCLIPWWNCLNLVIRFISSLGYPITLDELLGDRNETLMRVLVHTNTHMYFRSSYQSIKGPRVIHNKRRKQIENLYRIILIGMSSPRSKPQYLFQLKLIHFKGGYSESCRYCNVPVMTEGYDESLPDKVRRSADFIKMLRDRVKISSYQCRDPEMGEGPSINPGCYLGFITHIRAVDLYYSQSSWESESCETRE